ncbi:MAG: phosphotransferase, partial [Pseudomonadota bacterium]
RRREQNWYTLLPPGLSVVPEAIDAATGVMITPWVEGQLLTEAWTDLQPEHLLHYVSNQHRQLPDPGRDYQVGEIYRLQNTPRSISANNGPLIAPPVPTPEHLRQPCHNDLNPWNVLITPQGWITLDWEFVGNNDPLFDLVNLHQGLELPLAELPELTVAYLDRMDAPPATPERLHHVIYSFWYRELRWAQRQLSQGNDRPEIQDQVVLATQRLSLLR